MSDMITINSTGILAGRKLYSAAILAFPNPEVLHVFEEFRVEICLRLGVESHPWRRLAVVRRRTDGRRRAGKTRADLPRSSLEARLPPAQSGCLAGSPPAGM